MGWPNAPAGSGGAQLDADELAAVQGAASPSAANVFATVDDLPANELTADELAAVQGAASPSAANVFATVDDLPAAGGTATDWTAKGGVLSGPGAFDSADYDDAFTVSGTGTALDSITTAGSGSELRAQLTGTYGGVVLETFGAEDFMVVGRFTMQNLSDIIQVSGATVVGQLGVTSNAVTLAPYWATGYWRRSSTLEAAEMASSNNASWVSWNTIALYDIPWLADFDVAISQIGGTLRMWIGLNGNFQLMITKVRVATAGAVVIRMQGAAAQPIVLAMSHYAPVGVFAASATPPRLDADV